MTSAYWSSARPSSSSSAGGCIRGLRHDLRLVQRSRAISSLSPTKAPTDLAQGARSLATGASRRGPLLGQPFLTLGWQRPQSTRGPREASRIIVSLRTATRARLPRRFVEGAAIAGGRPAFGDRGGWGAFFAIIDSCSARGRAATVRRRSLEAPGGIVLLRPPPALLPALELFRDLPRDHRRTLVECGDVALGGLRDVQW